MKKDTIEKQIREESLAFIKQNRGLKLDFKTRLAGSYTSPRISSEYMDCSMPMTFDHYSHCSLGCTYCIPAGTKILMETGREKIIERIKAGEGIISYNEISRRFESSEIISTMKRKEKDLIKIKTGSKTISITSEHPVFIKNKGWIEAHKLKENDEVMIW